MKQLTGTVTVKIMTKIICGGLSKQKTVRMQYGTAGLNILVDLSDTLKMRLHYFNQAAPDGDDYALQAAVDLKHVPAGCLLGGVVIKELIRMGTKPCDACHGPRPRCGGTPFNEDVVDSLETFKTENLSRIHALLTGETDAVKFLRGNDK